MTNPYESPQVDHVADGTTAPQPGRDVPVRKLKVKCPKCAHTLKGATTAMVGEIGVCPHCKAEFEIRALYTAYEQVPWYRRSRVNSVFILVHFFTGGCVPLILWTCVNLITGDVYYDRRDATGNLETWSFANKVAAAAILLLNALLLCFVFSGVGR